eukprot:9256626-Alexandrium_andersonii.AAC.1
MTRMDVALPCLSLKTTAHPNDVALLPCNACWPALRPHQRAPPARAVSGTQARYWRPTPHHAQARPPKHP